MPNGNDNQVNPYEYLNEFSSDYSTSDAFGDIGYPLQDKFLDTTDPTTGLTYRDLIPDYDPYEEERMRTEFSKGAKSAYQSTVGELAGITSQTRQQRAVSGFAGGGEMQRIEEQGRGQLQGQYSDAFQGALLDLVSGIRGQRIQYQDDLASLLQSFGSGAFLPQDIPTDYGSGNDFVTGARLGNSDYYFPEGDEGDTTKAPNGLNYQFTNGTWSLIEGSGGFSEEAESVPTEFSGESIIIGDLKYVWNYDTQQYELEL